MDKTGINMDDTQNDTNNTQNDTNMSIDDVDLLIKKKPIKLINDNKNKLNILVRALSTHKKLKNKQKSYKKQCFICTQISKITK